MGNTMGIDMGYSFEFTARPFRGHVVERNVLLGAPAEVCEVGFQGPTKHVAIVSVVRIQSQERLQMEGSIRTGGTLRTARSDVWSRPFAAANFARVVEPDSPVAPTASELGQLEACSSIAQRISASTGPGCADDWQVAQANEVESWRPPPVLARTAAEPQSADGGYAKQSGMDGGFQRLVSDSRWPTSGTVDGAGFVQSIFADSPHVEESELETSPAGFLAPVWTAGISGCHPHGQWISLRNDWSGGAFALERLVDGFGDSSRIHRPWASRAERSARANASGVEGGDDATLFESPASAATAYRPLGKNLQPDPSAPRVGRANATTGLSSETVASAEGAVELFQPLGCAPCAKQWADQMARAQAFCGRGIHRLSSGAQKYGRREMCDLFCGSFDWRAVGVGPRWNTPSQICTTVLRSLGTSVSGREAQAGSKSRASRWCSLRSGSLRSPPRSEHQRDASPPNHSKQSSYVTNVCAQSVTHVCARCPLQPSPIG